MTAAELVIVVYGLPAAQGSKTPTATGGMREASKALKPWRDNVTHAALDTLEIVEEKDGPRALYFPFGDAPLYARTVFTFARPKSHYRTGKHSHELRPDAPTYKTSKPDVEKLIRSTHDALTIAGIWRDDAQVAKCVGIKRYGDVPGAEITVRAMDGTE